MYIILFKLKDLNHMIKILSKKFHYLNMTMIIIKYIEKGTDKLNINTKDILVAFEFIIRRNIFGNKFTKFNKGYFKS